MKLDLDSYRISEIKLSANDAIQSYRDHGKPDLMVDIGAGVAHQKNDTKKWRVVVRIDLKFEQVSFGQVVVNVYFTAHFGKGEDPKSIDVKADIIESGYYVAMGSAREAIASMTREWGSGILYLPAEPFSREEFIKSQPSGKEDPAVEKSNKRSLSPTKKSATKAKEKK